MVYGFVKQSQGHIKDLLRAGAWHIGKAYLPKTNQEERDGQSASNPLSIFVARKLFFWWKTTALREFAKSQLVDLGYRVLEATNGKDALRSLVARADIDLLFTDIVHARRNEWPRIGSGGMQAEPKFEGVVLLRICGKRDSS